MKDVIKNIINMVVSDICKDFLNVRTVVTFAILSTVIYCVVNKMIEPVVIADSWKYLLGFWFGTKVASLKKKVENGKD